jgi:hypothetical protein
MANRLRVSRVQRALEYPQYRTTSHEAIHPTEATGQNNPAASSTLRLVLGEPNVSVLPKDSQAWHREHLLAKR